MFHQIGNFCVFTKNITNQKFVPPSTKGSTLMPPNWVLQLPSFYRSTLNLPPHPACQSPQDDCIFSWGSRILIKLVFATVCWEGRSKVYLLQSAPMKFSAPPWILSFHGAKEATEKIGSFTFTQIHETNGTHGGAKQREKHVEFLNEFFGMFTFPITVSARIIAFCLVRNPY